MKVKLTLSGSLRTIYKDKEAETIKEIAEPITVKELLYNLGINPIVVPSILINGECASKDFLITEDVEIVVFGPLAGG